MDRELVRLMDLIEDRGTVEEQEVLAAVLDLQVITDSEWGSRRARPEFRHFGELDADVERVVRYVAGQVAAR